MKKEAYSFFCGIGIIESNDQLSMVHFCKVLIQDRSLGVADMQITTRLRRETRHYLSVHGILQPESKTSSRLVRASFVGLCADYIGQESLCGLERVKMREPAKNMRVLIVLQKTENFDIP